MNEETEAAVMRAGHQIARLQARVAELERGLATVGANLVIEKKALGEAIAANQKQSAENARLRAALEAAPEPTTQVRPTVLMTTGQVVKSDGSQMVCDPVYAYWFTTTRAEALAMK